MKQGKEELREIMKKIKYIFLQFPFYFWRNSLLHFCYTFLTDTRRLFKGYFWSHYISFFPEALARSMTLRNDYLYQMSSASQPLCPVEQALLLERRNLVGFVWGVQFVSLLPLSKWPRRLAILIKLHRNSGSPSGSCREPDASWGLPGCEIRGLGLVACNSGVVQHLRTRAPPRLARVPTCSHVPLWGWLSAGPQREHHLM